MSHKNNPQIAVIRKRTAAIMRKNRAAERLRHQDIMSMTSAIREAIAPSKL